jgi:hypothetical protein
MYYSCAFQTFDGDGILAGYGMVPSTAHVYCNVESRLHILCLIARKQLALSESGM